MMNATENIQNLARELEEVSLDVIDTQEPVLVSHWLRSGNELEVHYIVKAEKKIIKQQICIFGQVVEWNEYDGIKTGFVQEFESTAEAPVQEMIRYDATLNKVSLEQAIEVLTWADVIDKKWQQTMLANFLGKDYKIKNESFWHKIKTFFNSKSLK